MTDSAPPTTDTFSLEAQASCEWCGYELKGLAKQGKCPECGRAYTPTTALRKQPWPDAFEICVRLGWPVLALSACLLMIWGAPDNALGWIGVYAMIVSIAINSYLQVRWLLKRSLPEQTRTRGPVAAMRAIGTTLCVLLLLGFVGVPLAFGVGCMIILSQGGF